MTNIEQQRQDIQEQQLAVRAFTKTSEFEYGNFQFELGMQVLMEWVYKPESVQQLSYDKNFWSWFKMQYQSYEKPVLALLKEQGSASFIAYKRYMLELPDSKRIQLAFSQFLTIFKYIR